MAAARAVLDNIHESLPALTDDSNTYVLGDIQRHNVVIACLPTDQYGIVNAANVATNIKRTFPAIRVGLMVGIGGGVPSKVDVRLGDIVVGTRVMQVDLGKIIHGDQELERTAIPRIPHQLLGTAVTTLRAKHELEPSRIPSILQQKLEEYGYGCPSSPDRLFQANYHHKVPEANCDKCDDSKLVLRSARVSTDPFIHYGAIASGSQVIKNSVFRDEAARQFNVICFEMEAAGLMDIIPCLPIRGICDYSDSHKSKEWQRYAAATAAAYARELLEGLPVTETYKEDASIPTPNPTPSQKNRKLLLDSFRFEQINARKSTVEDAHAKTCQWFLNHPDYKAWLDPENLTHRGFLWISGKPGAGKSTIMKFVYSKMKKQARSKTALLEGFPDLQTLLDDPELIPAQDQNACPSLNILKGLLHKAVSLLGQRSFTCFIDALDECDEQQLLDMIQYFEYLSEQSTAKRLRICFSSRHYPYIMIRHGARLTLEHQPGHTEDLQAYVGDNLRTEDSDIVQKLLQKSAGVFMWVVLVVEILNRELARGAMSLDRKLEDLPSGLSNLFKEILKRDDENMEGLLLCFFWILCAKRPLRPEEFYHALWSGLSLKSPSLVDTKIPDALVQDTSNGLPRSHRYVISCSKGLAEVTISGKPSVQFIHESVRDFLIKDRGLYELWPQLGLDWESPSHDRLKDCCNFYINHKDVCELAGKRPAYPEPYRTKDVTEASNHYPFLGYSSRNTLYHANAAAKVVSQDDFLSSFHVINWVGINNLFEKSQIRLYTPHASLLYILADKGYPDLIRTRLQKFPEIHIFGERYEYPLFSALACSDKASVAALLNLPSTIYDGIDITEGLNHRKDLKRYEKRTPLSWAAENGRAVLLKLLIERGADVNTVDRTGWTPLLYASREGNEAIAKLLVEQGADVNTVSSNGWTPLLLTSIFGYVAIARILIEQGATLNAISLRGETSLSFASREGYEAFSRLLIEHGADINGIDGSRPLFLALENRREAIARLLIEQGADIHATDRHRHTPLSLASREGNEAIAKLLIEQGATINATTLSGETSLSFASRKGHEAIARLLIQEGADVNAADLNGGTPLFLTLKNGHEAIARLLIEGGADVNATDSNGRTPLSEAFAGSYEALAKFLIEWGGICQCKR
ncbi:hypothetical protein N7509_009816 [Penicillium cosmopolitanum]|uniref:Nucleoside phosphorylase domain-containing protein n=1 Tax=Penicillium cosmopolitanum TaxID=1131564 RepID=A0A9X0B414_9EURO|nr:uncharacterized protein N7509_009816 [Penicillium cosmopolitanum]KAJ5387275.1 hypothetical protein N7509_009816 [Penicillium cosmopolitanum]